MDRNILDEANIQRIGEEIVSVIEQRDRPKILISFENVDHLSSAALGTLITINNKVRARNGQLRLAEIDPQIYEVFVITKLNKLFEIHDSADKAARQFRLTSRPPLTVARSGSLSHARSARMTSTTPNPGAHERVVLHDSREDIERCERSLLDAVAARGYPEASRFALRLALEEAIINAFRHGHKNLPGKPVTVEWTVTDHTCSITVCDQGPGFKPESVPDPTLDENLDTPSGRGIMLMRAYMSEITYNEAGNCVTMVYTRPPAPAKPRRPDASRPPLADRVDPRLLGAVERLGVASSARANASGLSRTASSSSSEPRAGVHVVGRQSQFLRNRPHRGPPRRAETRRPAGPPSVGLLPASSSRRTSHATP